MTNTSEETFEDQIAVDTGEVAEESADEAIEGEVLEEEKPLDDDRVKIKLVEVEEEDRQKEGEGEDVNNTAGSVDYTNKADKPERNMQPFRETLSELEMLAKVGK